MTKTGSLGKPSYVGHMDWLLQYDLVVKNRITSHKHTQSTCVLSEDLYRACSVLQKACEQILDVISTFPTHSPTQDTPGSQEAGNHFTFGKGRHLVLAPCSYTQMLPYCIHMLVTCFKVGHIVKLCCYAPRKISREHIVAALSVRQSVRPVLQKWPLCWDDVSRGTFGSLPWRSRSQHNLAAKSCPAHNFVIWSRVLKIFHRNDHPIETTCHAQHLGHYLEGQGHSMTFHSFRPITLWFVVNFYNYFPGMIKCNIGLLP